jgi:hypothetical protein
VAIRPGRYRTEVQVAMFGQVRTVDAQTLLEWGTQLAAWARGGVRY